MHLLCVGVPLGQDRHHLPLPEGEGGLVPRVEVGQGPRQVALRVRGLGEEPGEQVPGLVRPVRPEGGAPALVGGQLQGAAAAHAGLAEVVEAERVQDLEVKN